MLSNKNEKKESISGIKKEGFSEGKRQSDR